MLVVLTAKKIKTLTLDTSDASDMTNLAFKFSDVEIRFPCKMFFISIHTDNRMLKVSCAHTTDRRFYFLKLQFTFVAIIIYTYIKIVLTFSQHVLPSGCVGSSQWCAVAFQLCEQHT